MGRGHPTRWVLLALLLLAAAAYAPWLDSPFHFDDRLAIEENPALRHLGTALSMLTHFSSRGLSVVSYGLDHFLWGRNPLGFHLTNLLLHVAMASSAGLLAAALMRIRPALGDPAWVGTASFGVFLLHPLNSQAAVYLSARPDILAALLALGSARAVLAAAGEILEGRRRGGWRFGALAVLLTALAFTAKETGILGIPLGLLLVGWRCFEAGRLRRVWAVACGLGLMILPAALWLYVLSHPGAELRHELMGPPGAPYSGLEARLDMQTRVQSWYLLPRLIAPLRLCINPGPPLVPPEWPWASPLGLLLMLTLLVLALLGWRRGGSARLGALAWAWWFLGQAVTIAIYLSDPVMEHRVYLAMAVPAVFAGWILVRVAKALPAWGRGPLLASLALIATLRCGDRASDYRSSLSLWREVVRDCPSKPGARLNLGQAYDVDEHDPARATLQYAKGMHKAGPVFRAMIINNIGNIQMAQKQYEEAVRTFSIALHENPGHPDIRMNRALAMAGAGRAGEAERELTPLADRLPGHAPCRRALAKILSDRGALDEAAGRLRESLALDPDFVASYVDLGELEVRRDRQADAREVLEAGSRRCGHRAVIWEALGRLLLLQGDLTASREAAAQALEIDPRTWSAYDTLAAVLDKQGDPAGALAVYRRAILFKPDDPDLQRVIAAREGRRGGRR